MRNPLLLLLIATTLEVSGDAVARLALHGQAGPARIGLSLAAAALLFGYGLFLNLAPLDFGRVVGLYIAILFTVWQVQNFLIFGTRPTLAIVVGGAFVIAGGVIVTFWTPT
jgi:small multidrug resistance family-3 protein